MSDPRARAVGWPGRRRASSVILAAVLAGAAVIACTPAFQGEGPTSIGDPTAPPVPASPVEGIVTAVTSSGLGQVERFNVRLADGTTIVLHMGVLENATEFPPGHLAEHQATSSPIRAFFRDADEGPTVYRLEDADEAPGAT